MVDRPRLERGTNGLKVHCSTNWANDPKLLRQSKTIFNVFILAIAVKWVHIIRIKSWFASLFAQFFQPKICIKIAA